MLGEKAVSVEPVTVYQFGRAKIWFGIVGSGAFVAASLYLLVDDGPGSSSSLLRAVWALFLLTSLLFFGAGLGAFLFFLFAQKPLVTFSDAGIECGQGEVRWNEIERVLEVIRSTGKKRTTSLLFLLRRGTVPRRATARYQFEAKPGTRTPDRFGRWLDVRYGLPEHASPSIELTTFACRPRAMKALAHFHPDPVESMRLEELRDALATV